MSEGEAEAAWAWVRDSRAQATAWFAPLPPKPVEKDSAVRVSPPTGMRGVRVTRSTFREPITDIVVREDMVDFGLMETRER